MKKFLPLLILLIYSCNQTTHDPKTEKLYQAHSNSPGSTIEVHYAACTECLDAEVLSGYMLVPPDLKNLYGDTLQSNDVYITGNIPKDVLAWNNEGNSHYTLTGKLIAKILGHNGNGPLFYVETWKAIKNEN